jgi:hypothetical protein
MNKSRIWALFDRWSSLDVRLGTQRAGWRAVCFDRSAQGNTLCAFVENDFRRQSGKRLTYLQAIGQLGTEFADHGTYVEGRPARPKVGDFCRSADPKLVEALT